jgi:hypothetical protein
MSEMRTSRRPLSSRMKLSAFAKRQNSTRISGTAVRGFSSRNTRA